jgi:hypothetical protein
MEVLAQFGNTIAIAVVGVLVWFYLRGRFEHVDERFNEQRQEIADLRSDGNRRFELLMTEINAVRSDLTHVALAVGARTRPEANQA